MCDCIKRLERKYFEVFGEGCQAEAVTCFCIDKSTGEMIEYLPLQISMHGKKRNGSFKKGKQIRKVKAPFCPLCGNEIGGSI